jgi:hypothetical protein
MLSKVFILKFANGKDIVARLNRSRPNQITDFPESMCRDRIVSEVI